MTRLPTPEPRFHLGRSLGNQRFGLFDPTAELTQDVFEKAYHTSAGVVCARVTLQGESVHLEVEGPGAEEELARWSALWPPDDGYRDFAPEQRHVIRLHNMMKGLRILRQPWLFDIACRSILQQRVTWREGLRSWRRMVGAMGERYGDLLAFPSARRLARTNPGALAPFDIDLKRARAIVGLARSETASPFLGSDSSYAVLRTRLHAVPGIGEWTTELTVGTGAGDTDAVPTGDLHLPHKVSWMLAGEARGTDERMLELLEPYQGQRFRVIRLLSLGKVSAPTFGPKKPRRSPR